MAERRVGRMDAAMAALQEKLAELQQKAGNIPQGIADQAQSLEQMIIDQAAGRTSRARAQQVQNIAGGMQRQVDGGSDQIFKTLASLLDTDVAGVKQHINIYGLEPTLAKAAERQKRPRISANTAYQAVNEAIANDPNVRRIGGPLAAAAGAIAGTGALMEWNDPDRGFAIVAGPNVNQAAMQDIIEFLENGDPLRRETETIA